MGTRDTVTDREAAQIEDMVKNGEDPAVLVSEHDVKR
jgi:hypothetical protein